MKFNLEEQYQLYLQKVNLDESKMGEIQKSETRQAFFAGVSQATLHYFSLAGMEENDAVEELDNMMKQVTDFWTLLNLNNN